MNLFSVRAAENILYPQVSSLAKKAVWVLIGTILLGISAQIVIPLKPVPLTFQSSAVILLGMLYGARLGASTVFSYLIMGFAGVPLFAQFSGGPSYILSPTAGYLFGFLPAAFLSGYLAERGWAQSFLGASLVTCVSVLIIFLAGFVVLTGFVGAKAAWAAGVQPFLFTEPCKLLVVAFLAPRFWRSRSEKAPPF